MKKNKSYKNINSNLNNTTNNHLVIYDNLEALSPKSKQKTTR
jgi:hypothetical protein